MPEILNNHDVGLLELFAQSYAGWTHARPYPLPSEAAAGYTPPTVPEGAGWDDVAAYVERSGSNAFVQTLVSALTDLYALGEGGIGARELGVARRGDPSPPRRAGLARGGDLASRNRADRHRPVLESAARRARGARPALPVGGTGQRPRVRLASRCPGPQRQLGPGLCASARRRARHVPGLRRLPRALRGHARGPQPGRAEECARLRPRSLLRRAGRGAGAPRLGAARSCARRAEGVRRLRRRPPLHSSPASATSRSRCTWARR